MELKLGLDKDDDNETMLAVTGQVLDVNPDKSAVLLRLSGLLDEEDTKWIKRPPHMPDWALENKIVFLAKIPEHIESFEDLNDNLGELTNFEPSPSSLLSLEQLKQKLQDFINRHPQV